VIHDETLECPCRPEPRDAVGGGRVMVHRLLEDRQGRATEHNRALDRYCRMCGEWHIVGHEHLERLSTIGQRFAQYLAGLPLIDSSARAAAFIVGHP